MNNVYFDFSNGIGNLIFEYSFLSYEGNDILFTLIDNTKNRYICLCTEIRNYNNWILVQLDDNRLVRLLENKCSVKDVFCENNEVYFISNKDSKEEIKILDIKELSSEDLPDDDVYLDLDENQKKYLCDYFDLNKSENIFTSNFLSVTVLSEEFSNLYSKMEYRKVRNHIKKSFIVPVTVAGGVF